MSPLTEPTRLRLANGQVVANDPQLYTNTVLLLHCDGTNGSTSILDSSRLSTGPKTVTAFGDAKISTAQSKFGGTSVAFDGNGDYLETANNSAFDFGTADFTIESWFYIAGNSAINASNQRTAQLVTALPTGGIGFTSYEFGLGGNATTTGVSIGFFKRNAGYPSETIEYVGTITQAQWHHVAVARFGVTTRLFYDGLTVASVIFNNQIVSNSTYPLRIGSSPYGGYLSFLNGYIDELRITKGVARYTADFTPPTAPFPDF